MSSHTLDIAVIIPFKDKAAMTLDCVKSLLKYGPAVTKIVLVSNNSSQNELEKVKTFIEQRKEALTLLEYNRPFNYQKINNWAVKKSGKTRYIMFLNNDTELRNGSKGIIEKMCSKASNKNVGITGCLLLYGNEVTIQHAGVYLVPGGLADHLYVGKSYRRALAGGNDFPYDVKESRPLTAVTGAVNILERKKFEAVKGYDERFIICGGDVDLCIRMNQKGWQTWYVGGGYILHKESQSRAHKPVPYNDFYYSYLSYVQGFDTKVGDPFLPKITKALKVF